MFELALRNFVIYFDLVIEGSKSINSLTTSKLVSMVKRSFKIRFVMKVFYPLIKNKMYKSTLTSDQIRP